MCGNDVAVCSVVLYGIAEQGSCILLVLVGLVFRKKFLILAVSLLETLDSLVNEGVDDELVVVPVKAHVLQNALQFLIVVEDVLVEFAPHLAVSLV